MKPYVVTVKYLVSEARDGADAIHRASQYQICRAYHEVVQELDCSVECATRRGGMRLIELARSNDNPIGLLPGERIIDGEVYYSADWL